MTRSILVVAMGLALCSCASAAPPVSSKLLAEDSFSPEDASALAGALGAPAYVVAHHPMVVWSGHFVGLGSQFGVEMGPGSVLSGGAILNVGTEIGVIFIGENPVEIGPGEMAISGPVSSAVFGWPRVEQPVLDAGDGDGPKNSCAVECGTGFYACCSYGPAGGSPTCVCRRVTVAPTECSAGGLGAIKCGVTQ